MSPTKKRQWQDLNLRLQRRSDFESHALDHSATLSLYFTFPFSYICVSLLIHMCIPSHTYVYPFDISLYPFYILYPISVPYPMCLLTHFLFFIFFCAPLVSPLLYIRFRVFRVFSLSLYFSRHLYLLIFY